MNIRLEIAKRLAPIKVSTIQLDCQLPVPATNKIEVKKEEKKMTVNTPWGIADRTEKLADGIISYSTPSHGGIGLSPERQAELPAGLDNFLHSLEWWEEDCDWVVPYIVFKDDIQKHGKAYKFTENLAHAYIIAKRHHPEILNGPGPESTPAPEVK